MKSCAASFMSTALPGQVIICIPWSYNSIFSSNPISCCHYTKKKPHGNVRNWIRQHSTRESDVFSLFFSQNFGILKKHGLHLIEAFWVGSNFFGNDWKQEEFQEETQLATWSGTSSIIMGSDKHFCSFLTYTLPAFAHRQAIYLLTK